MLEKINFRNGVILSSSTLNEVQKGTVFNPRLPREDYYGLPTSANESIWYISERDGIKDWELADPDIETQSNIGRLAYDGVILGCNNCDVDLPAEDNILEIQFGPPRVTYRDIAGTLLPQNSDDTPGFGVFVNSGSYLDSSGQRVSWGLSTVVVDSGTNYIYYDIETGLIVANTVLPNKTRPHIPLAEITIDPLTTENDEVSRFTYVDLRPGVFIYSDSRIDLSNNENIIIDDHTLSSWERIFVDTSNGSVNITLPSSPVDGDRVAIFDISGTFDIYPVILYVENNIDSTILRDYKDWELNKKFSNTELIYYEPLDLWIFSDHDLNLGTKESLGDFISCGGTECIGETEPEDCPNGQRITAIYPNPSEGTYDYGDDGRCYKILDETIAVYSDGEGGFIKAFNAPRCNRDFVLPQPYGEDSKTIYVDATLGNDSIENRGLKADKPLRTIERALIEAVKGKSKYTIKLSPGEYYVDNRPSTTPAGLRGNQKSGFNNLVENASSLKVLYFNKKEKLLAVYDGDQECVDPPVGLELGRVVYNESGAYGTIVYAERDKNCVSDCGWRFTLEGVYGDFKANDTLYYNDLSSINSSEGGLIVPKGVSIIGEDTRKTIIRPIYVPSINFSHSYILRLSANSYISNLTVGDNLSIKRSHDNLTSIAFVSQEDVIDDLEADNRGYFYRVSTFLDESEIISRYQNNLDSEIVANAPFDRELRFQDVKENLTGDNFSDKEGHPDLIRHPGAISIQSNLNIENPSNVSIPDINSSYSGSPYIHNCTVRSIFGLNGLHANGNLVSGFKSIIADSFTVISIQVDPDAYENGELSYINDPASPVSPKKFKLERRHFAYKASNQAFIQSSSAFVIGAADHFLAEDGGEISLIGSNSSFGDNSLVSKGFYSKAFTQDYAEPSVNSLGSRISQIIPPKNITENLRAQKVFTGFKILYTLSKLYYEENPDLSTYRLYIESSDPLNPLSETNLPNTNLMGDYSFTKRNDEDTLYLSGGNYRRNYLYITGVDGTVYKTLPVINTETNELDDKTKIFKYDSNPTNSKQSLGSGTINRATNSVIVTTNESILEIKRNSYIEIENKLYQVSIVNPGTTFTSIDLLTPLSDTLEINKAYTVNALKTNIDGGRWYIEVKNEGIDTSISDSFITDALSSLDSEIKILDGQSIFIIRDLDMRSPDEKNYRIRLDGYLSTLGLRDPQKSYIIQKQEDLSNGIILNQDNLPYVLTNVIKTDIDGAYYANVVTSDKYRLSLTNNLIPQGDLDNPEDDSLEENITKDSILAFINDFELEIADSNNNIVSEITPSNDPYFVFAKNKIDSLTELRIKLHRPSTIRSSSHQWEWVGYLSYDTALPKFQGPKFSEEETLLKHFKEVEGGIIYASGTTQDGEFFINNSPIDNNLSELKSTSTAAESRAIDPQDTIVVNKELRLSAGSNLYVSSNASTIFYGNNYFLNSSEQPITVDSNSSVLATEARAGLTQLSNLEDVEASLSLVEPAQGKSTVITNEILASESLRATTDQKGLISLAPDVSDSEDNSNAVTPSGLNSLTATSSRAGLVKLAPPGTLFNLDASDIALVPSNLKNLSITGGSSSYLDVCDIRLSHSSTFSFPTINNTTTDPLSSIFLHGSKISLYNESTGWFVKAFTEVLEFDCDRLLNPDALTVMTDDETYELFLGLNSEDTLVLTAKLISTTTLFEKDQILVDSDDHTKRYVGRLTISNVSSGNTTYLQYLGGEIDNISDPDTNISSAPTQPTIGLVNYYNRFRTGLSYIFKNDLEYNYKYISNNEVVTNTSFASLVGSLDITTIYNQNIEGILSATNGAIERTSGNSGKIKIYNYATDTTAWTKYSDVLDTGNSPEYKYMDMSRDGSTIAVGVRNKNEYGSYSGSVMVYRLSGSTWVLIPSNSTGINTINNSPYFRGHSVALSVDGNTLAVKTYVYNSVRSKLECTIKVYNYTGGSWVNRNFPMLSTLNEFLNPIDSPYSMDISDDGLVIATSFYNPSSNNRGEVSIYEYNTSTDTWAQKGDRILGITGNETGWSLSLNGDGNRIAIGAPADINNRGSVKTYELNGSTWELLGNNTSILVGETDNQFYGYSVCLQTDSVTAGLERLAVGAPGANNFTGYTKIYSLVNSAWGQLDGTIYGYSTGDELGGSVSISSSAAMAVGSKFKDVIGEDSGQALVYSEKNAGAPWTKKGLEISGSGPKDELGSLVVLSSNSERIAVSTKNAARYKNILVNSNSIHTQTDSLTLQIRPSIQVKTGLEFVDYNEHDYYTTGEVSHELSSMNSMFNFPTPNETHRIKIKYDYRISSVSDETLIPSYDETILRKYRFNTSTDDPNRKNGILVTVEV